MKKKLALILIAIMAVFMVAGCSNADDKDTAQTTEPSSTTETTVAATDQQKDLITEKKAKDIALKKVAGAKEADFTEFKLDKDDGRQEYEGKLVHDGKEYEFEIDAVSGDVLKWEEKALNK